MRSFADSTGRKVNYHESNLIPINIEEENVELFTNTMSCRRGFFPFTPFTYLGLPLGLSKPRVEHYMPIVSRTERRLSDISCYLTYGGKLLMVKVVLSSTNFLHVFLKLLSIKYQISQIYSVERF